MARLARPNRPIQPAVWYTAMFVALVVLAVLIQFGVHAVRTNPRDSRVIAERELRVNSLEPGEKVTRIVSVFRRPAIDFFRATRGVLALTDKRLIYVGLEPRDLLAGSDLPPTFEERDFPLDTSVHVSAGRTFFLLAKAVVIRTPDDKLELGVPSGTWPQASLLVSAMEGRHQQAVVLAAQQRKFMEKTEAERKAAEAARHKAKYYTVERGDALASIATIWNTTPSQLRSWNHLPDNRIRVGQTLMVRPAM